MFFISVTIANGTRRITTDAESSCCFFRLSYVFAVMDTRFDFDVFVSYSSRDRKKVTQIAEYLRDNGLQVWFDKWSIEPGDDIFLRIESGLERSRTLLFNLSTAALSSDWVSLERNTALFRDPLNRDRRFLPVLLDNCASDIPDVLKRYRYIDACRLSTAIYQEILYYCRHGSGIADVLAPVPTGFSSENFSANSQKKTILIVDDEFDSHELIEWMITELKPEWEVCFLHAWDGIDAQFVLSRVRPDLIILDLMMPNKSGFSVLEWLNENFTSKNRPRVVVLSLIGDFHTKRYVFLLGANRYFIRPIDPFGFLDDLEELLFG